MHAVFATWNDRLAPLFDTSDNWMVYRVQPDGTFQCASEKVGELTPEEKVCRLVTLRCQLLVCGAISRHLQNRLEDAGIRVAGFRSGLLDCLVTAWMQGDTGLFRFMMPGCRKHRRRQGNRNTSNPCILGHSNHERRNHHAKS